MSLGFLFSSISSVSNLFFSSSGSILSSLGSIGGGIGGSFGGLISSAKSSLSSYNFDDMMFGLLGFDSGVDVSIKEPKVTTSTYNKLIPEVFGTMVLGGNIIWMSEIKRSVKNRPSFNFLGINIGGNNDVRIRASFAIAICSGKVDVVGRIFANNNLLDEKNLKIERYIGSEDQIPNKTIESYLGSNNVPAFKGICYVVFTDFPLEIYEGKMPNLSFEITRTDYGFNKNELQEKVTGLNIIPGCGEFVYDTHVIKAYESIASGNGVRKKGGPALVANSHNPSSISNFVYSVNQAQEAFQNLKWTSLVASWFTDSLSIKNSSIYPAVEKRGTINEILYENGKSTKIEWSVAGKTRGDARLIGYSDNRPRYGGTVNDKSVLRAVRHLSSQNLKVCFNPMIFVDIEDKPWRGWITGNAEDVDNFFNKSDGYNNFIMHYANLLKGNVDAFIIGSELKGITSIKDSSGAYPAVEELIKLSDKVRAVLGPDVIITYAADWSEYHHDKDGYFNLDNLWSAQNINVIGIDGYFPLSNSNNSIYDKNKIKEGWRSGEGWDFFYTDKDKETKKDLEEKYAWKNIEWFLLNEHTNPDGAKSSWVPRSKRVWLTEFGFPSVDCASNQPNVFFSEGSRDSGFPIKSVGKEDFLAQSVGIIGSIDAWELKKNIVEEMFIWCWDARPYPAFPSLESYWIDGKSWSRGHFLNGKVSYGSLGDIVTFLSKQCGIDEKMIDVSGLAGKFVRGFLVDTNKDAVSIILELAKIFMFGCYIENGMVKFSILENSTTINIEEKDIVLNFNESDVFSSKVFEQRAMPKAFELMFFDVNNKCSVGSVRAINPNAQNNSIKTESINVVLDRSSALAAAYKIMFMRHFYSNIISLTLPIDYLSKIKIMSTVSFNIRGRHFNMIVRKIDLKNKSKISIAGHATPSKDVLNYSDYTSSIDIYQKPSDLMRYKNDVDVVIFEAGLFRPFGFEDKTGDVFYSIIPEYSKFDGCDIYASENKNDFKFISRIFSAGTVGICLEEINTNLPPGVDEISQLKILLYSGSIPEPSKLDILKMKNIIYIDGELISYEKCLKVDKNKYVLTNLKRGLFGTEAGISKTKFHKKAVLMNEDSIHSISATVSKYPNQLYIKAVPFGLRADDIGSFYTFQPKKLPLKTPDVYSHNQKLIGKDIEVKINPRQIYEDDFFHPSNKNLHKYRADVMSNDGQNILRSLYFNENGIITYTNQMQISDFGHDKSIIDVRISGEVLL